MAAPLEPVVARLAADEADDDYDSDATLDSVLVHLVSRVYCQAYSKWQEEAFEAGEVPKGQSLHGLTASIKGF